MRTLSRPMFNMGGPIKQGIMQGIREPHQLGQIVGAAGKIAPRLGPMASKVFGRIKNIFGKRGPGTQKDVYGGYSEYGPVITRKVTTPGAWQPSWLGRDPLVRGVAGTAKGLYKGVTSPTAKTWAEKGFRVATAPSTIIGGVTWYLWPDGTQRKDPPPKDIMKPGGFPKADEKKIKKATAAFAEAQRDTRVKKYLDMMGYDRSKKTAVADALIDASKIVSDRGSLKGDVTRELINPIIQATSKRFDKPEQIREAVGLMTVKAAIEKDLEDPQVKKLRALEIETKEKLLGENFETDMRNLLLSRKDKVNKDTLKRYARLTADKYGEPFTEVTEDTDLTTLDDGIYMSESEIIRVTDGVPKRIV